MTLASVSSPQSDFPKRTLVALVAFAAITPLALLVAPALAAQLGAELQIGPSQIGTYFFVENGAFSAASLLSLLWLGRINIHAVGLVALAVFIIGNLATPLVLPNYTHLLLIRACTGFGGGTLMVLSMVSGQDARNPDRVFGYWVVGQLVAGAAGLFLLPHLFASFGLKSFYLALGIITLLLAPLYRGFLAPSGAAKTSHAAAGGGAPIVVILTVAAILAFYILIGGVWTFANVAAATAGISNEDTGGTLAIASLFGIAGALTATYLGGNRARKPMLLLGYAILLLSVLALAIVPGAISYGIAVCAFKFAWTFVLPFIVAEAANRDRSGKLLASTTMIIGTGLSLGPLFAGLLLGSAWSIGAVFIAAAACGVLSFACLFLPVKSKTEIKEMPA
jgi:predicted MFS family arabinose efflux permease